ncbi:MAG: hypothetical protein ACOYJE_08330 [Bacteroidaceae bacterium]|jgi:hypothetical protein
MKKVVLRSLAAALLICPSLSLEAASPSFSAVDSSLYVAVAIHYESDRPLEPLPAEHYMRYAYDERDAANSFDFSAYLLQDTTGYLSHFPAPYARNLVKLFAVEQAWSVDSLAAYYADKGVGGGLEAMKIPQVMRELLGSAFQVSDGGLENPNGFYADFLSLRYRGRNCQVIWDDLRKLDVYHREADWETGQEAVTSYSFDYSFRDARSVILGRTAAGNYVLLMLTRDVVYLQSRPVGLFGSVKVCPDSLGAVPQNEAPRLERLLPVARDTASCRFVAVHVPQDFRAPVGGKVRFAPPHGSYEETDCANAFAYEAYALRDTAACRDSLTKYGLTDRVLLFEVVKAWNREELKAEYASRGGKWRKRGAELTRVMRALLGEDFEEVRDAAGYPSYLSVDNLHCLQYKGRNCQPVWDDPEKFRIVRSEQNSENRQLGTVWYCTFDYFLGDARRVILGRTTQGNYVLLLLTQPMVAMD